MLSLGWLGWRYVSVLAIERLPAGGATSPHSRRELDTRPDTRITLRSADSKIQLEAEVNKKSKHLPVTDFEANEAGGRKNQSLPTAAPKRMEQPRPMPFWQRWRELAENANYQQIPIVSAVLSRALQQNPDPAVYQAIAEMLWQPETAVDKKALVLDLLSQIATPESLELLLTLAEEGLESDLYLQTLQAIARISDYHWQGRYHHELSPVLLTAWTNSSLQDHAFYQAVATALACVGDPDAVNALLLAVAGQTKGTSNKIDLIKQQAAFTAVPKVTNPQAVEVLGDWFAQEPVGAPAFEASGAALAEIGTRQAVQKIFAWAKTAPAQGARNLQEWLGKIDDVDSLLVIAGRNKQTFHSPEVEAVFTEFGIAATSGVPNNKPDVSIGSVSGDEGVGVTQLKAPAIEP